MTMPILEIKNLAKHFRSYWTYRKLPAVADVSLSVLPGEAFGFLGHNGAGKTTTMKCVVGLLKPNSGQILYCGKSVADHQIRKEIGYLPELPYFYDHLSVFETIDLFARLHGIDGRSERRAESERVLSRVGILERSKQRVRELSKGLQQRLGMAGTLLGRPKLVLLDEPFSGLDPLGRKEFRDLLMELKSEGTTIFLSTHVLSDIEDICDRVAIMARGKLEATFSLAELPRLFGSNYELTFSLPPSSTKQSLGVDDIFASSRIHEGNLGTLITGLTADYEGAEKALAWAARSNLKLERFGRVGPSLEEVFVQITERSMRPETHPRMAEEERPHGRA